MVHTPPYALRISYLNVFIKLSNYLPFVRVAVKFSVQLTHSDRFRVKVESFHLFVALARYSKPLRSCPVLHFVDEKMSLIFSESENANSGHLCLLCHTPIFGTNERTAQIVKYYLTH